MDKSSIAGVLIAIAGIVAGLLMEGGRLGQVLQPTAALIVFGGTLGAVLLQFPLTTVFGAFRAVPHIFVAPSRKSGESIQTLVNFAQKARRSGVVSLDADLPHLHDPFMRQALTLAVDGTEPEDLRKMMQVLLDSSSEREERKPAVFESAGGFSPTVGILPSNAGGAPLPHLG